MGKYVCIYVIDKPVHAQCRVTLYKTGAIAFLLTSAVLLLKTSALTAKMADKAANQLADFKNAPKVSRLGPAAKFLGYVNAIITNTPVICFS